MSDEVQRYPSDRKVTEIGKAVAEAAIGSIPLIGGPLAVALQYALGYRLADRQEAWLNDLAAKVDLLMPGLDWQELVDEPPFVDAVVQATRAAAATSEQAKRQALRNGVLHVALGDAPTVDEQARFFRLVDEFTVAHMLLLDFFSEPRRAFADAGRAWPNFLSSSKKAVFKEMLSPSQARDDEWLDLIFADLERARLVNASFSAMSSAGGLEQSNTTPLGERFLAFIAAPPEPRQQTGS
ncbi:hypothetical protein Kisp01_70320 [Kineosporia sp. NBRC 101677]|uniref:hypothetical protein n=1 Tax=Kineosporia sp. NBRC 101677 TaxID=3032197 RepID=UPI0024A379E8|nr:hypothetical protein [Kineosporia sp. NBRC 101677]GLY20018.1 hypothetical protein Kisp01_70320 [Kineosporia sp. NBRC 101677]